MRASASTTNFLSFVDADVAPLAAHSLHPASSSHASCPNLSTRVPSVGASQPGSEAGLSSPARRDLRVTHSTRRQAPHAHSPVLIVSPAHPSATSASASAQQLRVPSPAAAAQLATSDSLVRLRATDSAATAPPLALTAAEGLVTPRQDALHVTDPDGSSHGPGVDSAAPAVLGTRDVAPPAGGAQEAAAPPPGAAPRTRYVHASASPAAAPDAAPVAASNLQETGAAAVESIPVAAAAEPELVRSDEAESDALPEPPQHGPPRSSPDVDVAAAQHRPGSASDDEAWTTAVSAMLPDDASGAGASPEVQEAAPEAAGVGATTGAEQRDSSDTAPPAASQLSAAEGTAEAAEVDAAAALPPPDRAASTISAAPPPPGGTAPPLRISVQARRPTSADTASSPLPLSHAVAVYGAPSGPSEPASTAPSAPLDCFMPLPCPDASPTPSYAAVTPPSTTVSESSIAFPSLPGRRSTVDPHPPASAPEPFSQPPLFTPTSPASDSSAPGGEVSFVYDAFPNLPRQTVITGPVADAGDGPAPAPSGVAAAQTDRGPSSAARSRPQPSRRSGSLRRSAQEVFGAIRRTFSRRRSADMRAMSAAPPQPAHAPQHSPQSQFFKDIQESFVSLEDEEAHPLGSASVYQVDGAAQPPSVTSLPGVMPPSPAAPLSSQLSTTNSEGLPHQGSPASAPIAVPASGVSGGTPDVTPRLGAAPAPVSATSPLRGRARFSSSEASRRARSEVHVRPGLSRRSAARLGRLSACFCVPEQ